MLSYSKIGKQKSGFEMHLELAEYARKNPSLLQNHFEARIPQRLTSHLADILDIKNAYEKLLGTDIGEQLGAVEEQITLLGEEIRQTKRALTAYVPEASQLVRGDVCVKN
jgi:vacuolar-type H+-ATPase subunit D/Vma8